MAARTLFITGTDTGVGKTMLAALLATHLRRHGVRVAALKPICSGGRGDARALHAALGGALTLDEINPWHFRSALAPALAARREGKRVLLADVLARVRAIRAGFDVVLIEGAGGLLSPLGMDFDSRDLITALCASPIVVCPNRLGAVNQARLAIAALPRGATRRPAVVLMSPRRMDLAARSNSRLLAECLGPGGVFELPWLNHNRPLDCALQDRRVSRTLKSLLARVKMTEGSGARRPSFSSLSP